MGMTTRGYSLVEAAMVLAILSMAVASMAPAARQYRDIASVLAAQDAAAGLIAHARVSGIGRGGAVVRLLSDSSRIVATLSDSVLTQVDLYSDHQVEMSVGRRPSVTLSFDALGLGQAASATIVFRRGSAERALVISSYGRVRRR